MRFSPPNSPEAAVRRLLARDLSVEVCAWCGNPHELLIPASEEINDKLCPGCLYCYRHHEPRFDPLDG